MDQSVKEELIEALDRLSPEKLLAVLRFTRRIEQETPDRATTSEKVGDKEAERAIADFVAAAGCGKSGDPDSSLRVDELLYGH
jgi:hypothetical protein